MIKVPLSLVYIKRTIHPLYANTQATPKSMFLSPSYVTSTPDLYGGMALKLDSANPGSVLPVSGAGDKVYGLSGFIEAAGIGVQEISNQGGINACAVWVLGPDAEFQISNDGLDLTQSWASFTPGTLITATATGANQGKLAPVGGTGTLVSTAFARLLSVDSATQITIGGLNGTV